MFLKSLVIFITLLSSSIVWADMIIPIVINKKVQNVVTVAMSKGDFTDPVAAVNSITDASVQNPYLVYIGPGYYLLSAPLQMKPYVNIVGSGIKATVLKGSFGSTGYTSASVVIGSSFAGLSSLSIVNYGDSSTRSIGLYINNSSPKVENIRVYCSDSDFRYGIFIEDASNIFLQNIEIVAQGGTNTRGIEIHESTDIELNNIRIIAKTASSTNQGIRVTGNTSGDIYIRRSTLQALNANAHGIYELGSTDVYVSQSSILREVTGDGIKCVACDDGFATDTGSNCNTTANGI